MNTIQFDLGGGAVLALPAATVAEKLLSNIKQSSSPAMTATTKPVIGEYIPGQGGIYAGDIMGDDGVLYGLIIASPKNVGKASWGPEGELSMSEWDGLSNTNSLSDKYPAAKMARSHEADGHCDFYLPSRREMMVALANVPHLFDKEDWYWTSSLRSNEYPWAVDFEYGIVSFSTRDDEFRVRPFRRLSL